MTEHGPKWMISLQDKRFLTVHVHCVVLGSEKWRDMTQLACKKLNNFYIINIYISYYY